MNQRETNGIIPSGSKQPLSGSEQVQFGSGQAQSSSGQLRSFVMAVQMLLNKDKVKVENKPIDKKEQKRGAEKGLESIRIVNQINGDIKKSYTVL